MLVVFCLVLVTGILAHFVVILWLLLHQKIKPACIVDKVIEFWLDLVTPGRGAGGGNIWGIIRTIENSSDRMNREMDIRSNLRGWDRDHPQIHHELIVRYVCGAVVSVLATSLYNGLRRANHGNDPYYRRTL